MFLDQHLPIIRALCEQRSVRTLYAFGSVVTPQFSTKSDVDLLVDFDDVPLDEYADNYFALKFALETALRRPVDLLEAQAVKNPFFEQRIASQLTPLYERRPANVAA